MIIAEAKIWDNIIESNPRASKFRKKPFPLFDALGELYDGHIAQDTWNITSTQSTQNSHEEEHLGIREGEEDARNPEDNAKLEQDNDVMIVEKTEHGLSKRSSAPKIEEDKKIKKLKKDTLEGLVGRYLDAKVKQDEDEAAILAKEKEVAEANDFSIKRCISILRTMDVTREEKIKAAEVFNVQNNREVFISFNDDDPETALLWLRGKMDKL